MKKRWIRTLSLVLTLLFSVGFFAACDLVSCLEGLASLGFIYELTDDGKSYKVYGYNALPHAEYAVKVPRRYKGKKVTEIDWMAFFAHEGLTEVTLPDTITKIGSEAFSGCKKLKKINIPESVGFIGSGAFENCYKLETIHLPDGLQRIASYTFNGCTNLSNIVIPETVTSIGAYAFDQCPNLGYVAIPDTVEMLDFKSFDDGISGFRYTVDNCMKYYGTPSNPYMVAARALEDREHVVINENCILIDPVCFWYSRNTLKTVEIPASVKGIGDRAFHWCTNLESVVIPDGVEKLYWDTFSNCTALKSVTFGTGLTYIPFKAFDETESITEMIFRNTSGWYFDSNVSGSNDKVDALNPTTLADPTAAAELFYDYYPTDSHIEKYVFTKTPRTKE